MGPLQKRGPMAPELILCTIALALVLESEKTALAAQAEIWKEQL